MGLSAAPDATKTLVKPFQQAIDLVLRAGIGEADPQGGCDPVVGEALGRERVTEAAPVAGRTAREIDATLCEEMEHHFGGDTRCGKPHDIGACVLRGVQGKLQPLCPLPQAGG